MVREPSRDYQIIRIGSERAAADFLMRITMTMRMRALKGQRVMKTVMIMMGMLMLMKVRNREKDVKANNISIVFQVFWCFESLDKSRIPWCAFCCFIEIPDEKLPRDLDKASWLSVVKWKLTFSGKKWKLTFSGNVKVYFQWKSESWLSVETWKFSLSGKVKVFYQWESESWQMPARENLSYVWSALNSAKYQCIDSKFNICPNLPPAFS